MKSKTCGLSRAAVPPVSTVTGEWSRPSRSRLAARNAAPSTLPSTTTAGPGFHVGDAPVVVSIGGLTLVGGGGPSIGSGTSSVASTDAPASKTAASRAGADRPHAASASATTNMR